MRRTNSKFILPSILAVLALCLACACCAAILLYFYGDQLLVELGLTSPVNTPEPVVPATQAPVDTSGLPEWTVIVYSAADDELLEESMWFDINEMELVGSSAQVNIVVEIDRYAGAFAGDGDWTDTRRLFITQDQDLSTISSPVIHSLGPTACW